jgi:hypothetical protein
MKRGGARNPRVLIFWAVARATVGRRGKGKERERKKREGKEREMHLCK